MVSMKGGRRGVYIQNNLFEHTHRCNKGPNAQFDFTIAGMCGMGIEPRLFNIISIISSSRRLSEEASPTRAADDEEPYTPVFLNANSAVECNTIEQLS